MDKLIWIILTLIAGCFLPYKEVGKSRRKPCLCIYDFVYGRCNCIDYLYISHFSKYILERSERSTCLFLTRRNFGRFLCYCSCVSFPENRAWSYFWVGSSRSITYLYDYGTFPNYGYTTSADKYRKNSRNGNDCGRSSHYEKILNQK